MRKPTVPVVRAADEAQPGKGLIRLSDTDPCLVLGEGTSFLSQFSPKSQIMLSKSLNSAVAEVVEVISDTELRVKKEFGGENGKGTARFREAVKESEGKGIVYTALPFVDQQEMYRYVYQRLKEGGCIGIFPEGTPKLPPPPAANRPQAGAMIERISSHLKLVFL
jgi:glycerol-3-phosphate O-acyltransferase/dihydroxyacetone phosphate acyltransferase